MNTLFRFIMGLFQPANYNLRNFAIFLLVLFNIQYIPLETRGGVSMVKVGVMAICPIFFFLKTFKITRVFLGMTAYYAFVMIAAWMHPETFRSSTIIYLAMFIFMFITYYNLVYMEHVYEYEAFLNVVKGLMMAFTICLIFQQMAILSGMRQFMLINLDTVLDRGIGANSLSFEPSTFARTMAVLFLALLRLYEIKYGHAPTVKEMFIEARWTMLGFIWSMLTMGSGTAFVALVILSLYFLKRQYVATIVPLLVLVYFIAPYIDFVPLQRAYQTINASMTLDVDEVVEADGSAADRVAPLLNTFTKLDIFDYDTWMGHGIDYVVSQGGLSSRKQWVMVGGIQDYGLLSFIVMQIVIFTCVIRKILSVETLIWIFLFGLTFSNISYTWGAMIVFTTVRYFQLQDEKGLLEFEDDVEIESEEVEDD